jgi:hypothetical protein
MAFVTTSAGAASGLLTTWLNRKFVSDLEWELQFQKFTTKAIIPPGSGKIGRFNVFAPPPAGTSYSTTSTGALTENWNTQNEIATITANSTDITISEYGEFHRTSALAMYAVVPGTREKLRKRLVDGASITLDTLVKTAVNTATSNYLYATAAGTGGVTTAPAAVTTMGAATIIQARKILYANKVPGFSGLSGHPDKQYAAILGPKQELDIVTENTTGRIYWSQAVTNVPGRMGQEKWVNGYIGSIYGVAVYTTQNFGTGSYTGSSSGDISFVLGDGAVGAMAFRDMMPRVILNDVNSPYKNIDSVAWHSFFGTGLIDGTRVVKMYSTS